MQTRPDAIVHLAGLQSVPQSWQRPALAFGLNTAGTATLLRAVEKIVPEAHLLLASTAAVYGDPAPGDNPAGDRARPFEEGDPVAPASPYGASKAAAEVLVAESAARTGLPVTIARLFNQFGPDQPEAQLPAGFAASIAAAEAGGKDSVGVEVGNPGRAPRLHRYPRQRPGLPAARRGPGHRLLQLLPRADRSAEPNGRESFAGEQHRRPDRAPARAGQPERRCRDRRLVGPARGGHRVATPDRPR